MIELKMEMPEGVLASLRKSPKEFKRELRLAAAIKWYEIRLVSQGRAAEIAGISRSEFIDALGRYGVSVFQYDSDEILQEVTREQDLDDSEGRKCAASMGVDVVGTLGIIILAKKNELISSATTLLKALQKAGFYLPETTVRTVLKDALGEDWNP